MSALLTNTAASHPNQRYEATDEFAKLWLAYRDATGSAHERILYPSLLKALGPLHGKVVVDAGCGDGRLLGHLAKKPLERLLA